MPCRSIRACRKEWRPAGLWKVEEDGIPVQHGELPALSLKPGEYTQITLPARPVTDPNPGSEYFAGISFVLAQPVPWAEEGYEVAAAQFALPARTGLPERMETGGTTIPQVEENENFVHIRGDDFELAIDRSTGLINRYAYRGEILIDGPLHHNFWRPQTDNDRRGFGTHIRLAYWREAAREGELSDLEVLKDAGDHVRIRATRILPDEKALTTFEYEVYGNGWIHVRSGFTPEAMLPNLPRYGLQTTVPVAYGHVIYFGKGPHENYIDRQVSADVGLYESTVEEFGEPYIYPQENGNRLGVRWMALLNGNNEGLVISGDQPLSMSVWPNSQDEIEEATHTNELPCSYQITLNIDLIQMGVGGIDSWTTNAAPLADYQIEPEAMSYSFWIKPFMGTAVELGAFSRTRIRDF